jgi:phage tail protein X
MIETVTYKTQQGDRWDTIAYKAYGDPKLFNGIMQHNSNLPAYDVFPGGVEVLVPIIEESENAIDKNLLPPWKQ